MSLIWTFLRGRIDKISFPCCPGSAAVLVHQNDFSLSKYILRVQMKKLNFSIVFFCEGPNVSVWLKDLDAKWSYERNAPQSNSNKPQVWFLYSVHPGDSYGTASVANKSFQTKRHLIKWGQRVLKFDSGFWFFWLSCVWMDSFPFDVSCSSSLFQEVINE